MSYPLSCRRLCARGAGRVKGAWYRWQGYGQRIDLGTQGALFYPSQFPRVKRGGFQVSHMRFMAWRIGDYFRPSPIFPLASCTATPYHPARRINLGRIETMASKGFPKPAENDGLTVRL